MKKINNKAQIWGFDIMVALSLFLVSILLFFTYSVNNTEESYETFETMSYDANSLSNNLMSEGYPENWESSNVQIIGLTTDNRINETKLENLYDMIYSEGNYTKTKSLFNTVYDYYFYVDGNFTISGTPVEGIGKPGATKTNIDSKNLVKITRFTIYQNKTVPLYIYLWEE